MGKDEMMPVTVTLGPLPAASAEEFLVNAIEVLERIRAAGVDSEFDLPGDVADAFAGFLEEWLWRAQTGDPFSWSGEFDPLLLRRLVAYWFNLAGVISGRSEELGLPVAGPGAEPFYLALVDAVTEALAGTDDPEHVGARARQAWPGITEDDHHAATPPDTRIRTVVVDDTDDIRLLMRIVLGNDGRFDLVAEASDGAEAVALCERMQPDVVLLDLTMPVMDGFEAMARIREVSPRTRVVVHTARSAETEWPRCRALGAAAIVEKAAPLPSVADALASVTT